MQVVLKQIYPKMVRCGTVKTQQAQPPAISGATIKWKMHGGVEFSFLKPSRYHMPLVHARLWCARMRTFFTHTARACTPQVFSDAQSHSVCRLLGDELLARRLEFYDIVIWPRYEELHCL